MARSFKVYQGEDELPVWDLTEPDEDVHVVWEEIEAGGRAFRGESASNTIRIRDQRGETGNSFNLPSGMEYLGLPRGSRWEWLDGPDGDEVVMAAGRIGVKDYTRGAQKADRAREVSMQGADRNEELRNIIVDDWVRGSETDVARVNALITAYLSGSPRVTTNIANTYVASGNTVTLEAKTYDGTNPNDILAEIAAIANKNWFVTVDDELWYDTYDSTTYPAGLAISDRLEDIAAGGGGGTATFVRAAHTFQPEAPDVQIDYTAADADEVTLYCWAMASEGGTDLFATWKPTSSTGDDQSMTLVAYEDHSSANTRLMLFKLVNPTIGVAGISHVNVDVDAGGAYATGAFIVTGAPDERALTFAEGTSATATPDVSGALAGDLVFTAAGWIIGGLGDASQTPSALDSQTVDWADGSNSPPGQGDMCWAGGHAVGTGAQRWDVVTSTGWMAGTLVLTGAGVSAFPPIWDVGPASTEDGMELLSGLRLYYGQNGAYVYVNDTTTANSYWHSEESLYTSDPAIADATAANALAAKILLRRQYEERTYNVSIGPLGLEHVGLLKPGQLIEIKARAIPDADDQFVQRRVAQLKWTTPVPGVFFAHMQLDRPIKEVGYGVGPKQAVEATTQHTGAGEDAHPEYVARSVLTTQGDLPYRGASDWTRLAAGSDGDVLTLAAGVPTWDTPGAGSHPDLATHDALGLATDAELAAHTGDATDAHDASAISIVDAGTFFTGTDVEAALQELGAATGSSDIPATIVDAKGDLIVATAADTVDNLTVGTDGHVLTADSAETLGVKWSAPAGGGSYWDSILVVATDEDVTNNATPQDSTALIVAVDANGVYEVEFALIWSAVNAGTGARYRFASPDFASLGGGANNNYGAFGHIIDISASGAIGDTTQIGGAGGSPHVWPGTDRQSALPTAAMALNNKYHSLGRFTVSIGGTGGNLRLQFANRSAAVGSTTRLHAGSTMRVRKLNQ